MLCTRCDNEAGPGNPPVWSYKLNMYICMFCGMDEDSDAEEDDDVDDDE